MQGVQVGFSRSDGERTGYDDVCYEEPGPCRSDPGAGGGGVQQ